MALNFLDDWLFYCTHTESPPKYHLWSGLSIISHLIGRRIWMDCSIFVARPNMYIALVGEPGIKKSTAMKMALKVVQAVDKTIFTAPDSITKEAITQLMGNPDSKCKRNFDWLGKKQEFRQLSVFADEFVNLINAGGNAPGMIELLTGMWDTDIYRDHTKNKGAYDVPFPNIPILGCLTTETVKKLMTEKVISTGMSRRILFIVAEKNGPPQSRPKVSPEQQLAYDRALSHCVSLLDCCGDYSWAPETEPIWDKWYNENYYRMENKQSGDSALLNFLQTKPVYITKVAMLLALSDYTEYKNRLLYPEHFYRAEKLISAEEMGASNLFAGAGRNELAPVTLKIQSLIESAGSVPRIKALQQFHADCTPDEFSRILGYLTQTGAITEWPATYGSKTILMVGTFAARDAWLEKEKARRLTDLPDLPVGALPGSA